jgi:hypothetical protein
MRSRLGGVLLGNDRGRFSVPLCATVVVVAAVLLLALPNATVFVAYILLAISLGATAALIAIILDDRAALHNVQLTIAGGMILACLTLSFAGVYYRESQTHPHAFSTKLNRVSAVYLAVGTLSTNGTQGVQALSNGARADSIVQEGVDTTIVASFFGTLMWRLGYRAATRSKKRLRPGNPDAQADASENSDGNAVSGETQVRGCRLAAPTPLFTLAQPSIRTQAPLRNLASTSSSTTTTKRSAT